MLYAPLSGFKLGPYKLQECCGRGTFGTVYRATADDAQQHQVAIKVANEGSKDTPKDKTHVHSVALGIFSGGYGNISPVGSALLQLQCRRSQTSSMFPRTEGPFVIGETNFLVMEFLKGMTLRQLLNLDLRAGETYVNDLELSIKVFESLAALEVSELGYHGDLKPDNIVLSGTGVRVIDPGYFGPLNCIEGLIPNAVITSPDYYPCLEPDDAFASGAILWEIAMRQSPLRALQSLSDRSTLRPGPLLSQMILSQELVGRYFLSPMAKFVLPSAQSSPPPPAVEALLLRVLGLEVQGPDTIEKVAEPMKASMILRQLRELKKSGIETLNQEAIS